MQGFSKRRDSQNAGILKTQGFSKPRDKISSDLELQGIFFQGIPDPGQKNQGFEKQELTSPGNIFSRVNNSGILYPGKKI